MNNIIKINYNDGEVKSIQNNSESIGYYDLKRQIEELFKFKTNYKQYELIKLSSICDCMFDLRFLGKNKESKEILFQVC
jgi:hypothetical protein